MYLENLFKPSEPIQQKAIFFHKDSPELSIQWVMASAQDETGYRPVRSHMLIPAGRFEQEMAGHQALYGTAEAVGFTYHGTPYELGFERLGLEDSLSFDLLMDSLRSKEVYLQALKISEEIARANHAPFEVQEEISALSIRILDASHADYQRFAQNKIRELKESVFPIVTAEDVDRKAMDFIQGGYAAELTQRKESAEAIIHNGLILSALDAF